MGAKGIGVPGERVRTTKLQSFLDSWRQAFCIVRSGGQLGESNILLQVGAMEDPSSLEGELLGRAVEQMGGDTREFLAGLLEDGIEGGAAHRQPATCRCALASR